MPEDRQESLEMFHKYCVPGRYQNGFKVPNTWKIDEHLLACCRRCHAVLRSKGYHLAVLGGTVHFLPGSSVGTLGWELFRPGSAPEESYLKAVQGWIHWGFTSPDEVVAFLRKLNLSRQLEITRFHSIGGFHWRLAPTEEIRFVAGTEGLNRLGAWLESGFVFSNWNLKHGRCERVSVTTWLRHRVPRPEAQAIQEWWEGNHGAKVVRSLGNVLIEFDKVGLPINLRTIKNFGGLRATAITFALNHGLDDPTLTNLLKHDVSPDVVRTIKDCKIDVSDMRESRLERLAHAPDVKVLVECLTKLRNVLQALRASEMVEGGSSIDDAVELARAGLTSQKLETFRSRGIPPGAVSTYAKWGVDPTAMTNTSPEWDPDRGSDHPL